MRWFDTSRSVSWQLVLVSFLLVLPLAGSAAGQQTQGSIIGQVSDESGSVLPGVTVTVTSPALQVPSVSDVTNERGEYRLTPLPIGTYDVVYMLAGFQSLRHEGLRLTAGFVAKEDVVLKIGGLEESVTVSGASPVVDVTTTAMATQFTRQTLELTPTGRNGLYSLVAQIPAVRPTGQPDVGGNQVVNTPTMSVYGQTGENWVTIEGVSIQSPKTETQSGNYVDYSAMEEVRAEVLGSDVEGVKRGLKIQLILKSGGNDFHGSGFLGYTNDRFQSTNLTDALRAQGFTRGPSVVKRQDVSADIGGRIVRDQLWFYGSARKARNDDSPLAGTMPDGSKVIQPHVISFATAKGSYQMTPANKFISFAGWFRKYHESGITQFVPWESRGIQNYGHNLTTKIEWQGVRGNSLMSSLQWGYWRWGGDAASHTAQGKVATTDIRTMYVTGDAESAGRESHEKRYHPRGSLTWYRPGLFAGNHEFKFGFEYMNAISNTLNRDRGSSGNYQLVFSNGAPFQVTTFNYPATPTDPTHNLFIYGTDSWAVARRLTLNLGARYGHDNGFVPATCRVAADFAPAECYPMVQFPIWNSLSPRLHAAFDVSGNGKTLVKGGWSRYAQMRDSDQIRPADRAAPSTTTWTWRDLNGNKMYDPGDVNLNPTGPDYISTTGTFSLVPNPNERQPKTDELMVSIERELIPNFGVRLAGVYQRNWDQIRLQNNKRPYSAYSIPITNRDPGPDGAPNTADDGGLITYYDYPASLRGAAFVETMYVNDPNNVQTFKTIELLATKRLSNNWQLMASYSATKKNVPWIDNVGGGNDYPLVTFDPNAEINTADRTVIWQGQTSGAYVFPHQMSASINYQFRSGLKFARTVLFTGGAQIPSIVLRVEPIGTQQLDTLHLVDLRFEKTFTLVGTHRTQVRVNLYNAFNSSVQTSATARSGVNFLKPDGGTGSILPPRILVFSVSHMF